MKKSLKFLGLLCRYLRMSNIFGKITIIRQERLKFSADRNDSYRGMIKDHLRGY